MIKRKMICRNSGLLLAVLAIFILSFMIGFSDEFKNNGLPLKLYTRICLVLLLVIIICFVSVLYGLKTVSLKNAYAYEKIRALDRQYKLKGVNKKQFTFEMLKSNIINDINKELNESKTSLIEEKMRINMNDTPGGHSLLFAMIAISISIFSFMSTVFSEVKFLQIFLFISSVFISMVILFNEIKFNFKVTNYLRLKVDCIDELIELQKSNDLVNKKISTKDSIKVQVKRVHFIIQK